MIITIDGPVATGKSTIAKAVSSQLKFVYFDTGAMYRCFTWYLLHHNIDETNEVAIEKALECFVFDLFVESSGERGYRVDGQDVTEAIRSLEVTRRVSKIAMIGPVREKLVHWQREYAEGADVVFEGRDLGSVVFPNADLKIFLTGKDEIRAKRRFDEILANYPDQAEGLTLDKVLEDLRKRDYLDENRSHSPLVQPKNAKVVDTSYLTIDQVVDKIAGFMPQKGGL